MKRIPFSAGKRIELRRGQVKETTSKSAVVVLAMVALLSVAGCGALIVQPTSARHELRKEMPEVGAVTKVELGETMMEQKDYEVAPVVALPLTHTTNGPFPIDMEGVYEVSANGYYCGIITNRDPLNFGRKMRVCFTEEEFRSKVPAFKETEMVVPRPNNLERVVEYTGRIGNKITFSYREYVDTVNGKFIRPAFTQDFTFDLSEGSEIGLKGARIKVLEATNTYIKYEVEKHFPTWKRSRA